MNTENQPQSQEEKKQVQLYKNVADQVLSRINAFKDNGDIDLPKDYSPGNALKSAWMTLSELKDRNNQPALTVCTQTSIANALFKMAVQGLSVIKKQGAFIVYGTELQWQNEYTGNVVLAKRYGDLKSYKANAIFEGDNFGFEIDTETGRRKVTKHEQTLASFGSKKLLGAYCIYELQDGTKDVEIMNIDQITESWLMNAGKALTKAHKQFPDQQAIKTVINRMCKPLIRTSNDSAVLSEDDDEATQNTHSNGQPIEDTTYTVVEEVDFNPEETNKPAPTAKVDPEIIEHMQQEHAQAASEKSDSKQPEPQQSGNDLFSDNVSTGESAASGKNKKDEAPF